MRRKPVALAWKGQSFALEPSVPVAAAPLSVAAIALNRFGLGARPDDPPPSDPKRWLADQFALFDVGPPGFRALDDAGTLVQRFQAERRAARQVDATDAAGDTARASLDDARKAFRDQAHALYRAAVQARVDSALATDAPFIERLVHFWSNHFCISVGNPRLNAFAGAFERDAIRPHVLGRFGDMLVAVERHPAMLMFLNQAASIGPDSPAALRDPEHNRGLNENLGREILELHTLGVRSGYTQADVTEFARALTGWTVDGLGPAARDGGSPDAFLFRPARHEPGPRSLLGKIYGQDGEAQGRAILADLAQAPATGTHIATKLARHFAGDDPPPALVTRLSDTFAATGGDLPSLYTALIDAPEPWAPVPLKFKSPWEWAISGLRGLGRREAGAVDAAGLLTQLGQPVWRPGSPAGWDDLAATWMSPDGLLRRVEVAAELAGSAGSGSDARNLAARLIPASLSDATAAQIARAESAESATALMLVSPEFLRR